MIRLSVLAAVALLAASTTALAADCGTGVAACSCGDHVVTNTQLKASVDPVATTVCSAVGLTVASGVTLNVGGNKLRGDGTGIGIAVIDGGATNVVITNGTVKNFYAGIIGVATSTTVSRMVVTDTGSTPIEFVGDSNQIRKNVVQRCGDTIAVGIVGSNAVITTNVVADCGAVVVVGAGGAVSRNDVRRSSSQGIILVGNSGSVSENFVAFSSGSSSGIVVVGTSNTVVRNDSRRNSDGGIAATDGANILDGNKMDHNATYGLVVFGSGSSVTGNLATSNGEDGILSFSGNCSFRGNAATGNLRSGLLALDGGAGPDLDLGGNSGSGNGGSVQCEIDGVSCL